VNQTIEELKKEIETVWGNANFGMGKIDVVKHALLKVACNYSQGYTSEQIIRELGMMNKIYSLTKKGKYWLWELWKETNF